MTVIPLGQELPRKVDLPDGFALQEIPSSCPDQLGKQVSDDPPLWQQSGMPTETSSFPNVGSPSKSNARCDPCFKHDGIARQELACFATCLDKLQSQMEFNLLLTKAVYKKTVPGGRLSALLERSRQISSDREVGADIASWPMSPGKRQISPDSHVSSTNWTVISQDRPKRVMNVITEAAILTGQAKRQRSHQDDGLPLPSTQANNTTNQAQSDLRSPASSHNLSGDSQKNHTQLPPIDSTLSFSDRQSDMQQWRKDKSEKTTMQDLTRFIMDHSNRKSARVWRFLEDRESSTSALAYFYIRDAFVFFSVFLSCIDVADILSFAAHQQQALQTLQLGTELLFALELIIRFTSSPNRKSFCLSSYNIIDMLSLFPMPLRVYVLSTAGQAADSVMMTSLLGIVPVLRLLKFLRHFETFQLLLHSFRVALDAIPILVFTLFLMGITFAAMIYYVEPRETVPTMPTSLYFVMVTLSTVGFGDITPTTTGGRIMTIMLIVIGSLYMAIPFGIVGKTFSEVWEDRPRLLLLQRMRRCVERAGYTRTDLEVMFDMFDENGDGILDIEEFSALLQLMQVDADETLIRLVFASFEGSDGEFVDFTGLVRGLFPSTHWLMIPS